MRFVPEDAEESLSFKYDPFGRRIYKSSDSGTSIFAYDADNMIEEVNAIGCLCECASRAELGRLLSTRNGDGAPHEEDSVGPYHFRCRSSRLNASGSGRRE